MVTVSAPALAAFYFFGTLFAAASAIVALFFGVAFLIRNPLPRAWVMSAGNSFVRFPRGTDFPDNSTERHYWSHPWLHPYQVYGGPHQPGGRKDRRQVWTRARTLPGYALVVDDCSDRLYHVWIGNPAETGAEALAA